MNKLRRRINRYNRFVLSTVSEGLVKGKSRREILAAIKPKLAVVSARSHFSQVQIDALWKESIAVYANASRGIAYSKDRAYTVYNNLERFVLKKNLLNKTANSVVKIDNKFIDKGGVFYLCDTYVDCAEDHLPYQGKMYYKADWEELDLSDSVRARIRAYIRNHRLMSVEDVIAAGLCVRWNCRHKLHKIPINEVLSASAKSILKRHELNDIVVEHLSYQEDVLERYKEQFRQLYSIYEVAPSEKLRLDLIRVRRLVQKWIDRAK